MNLSKKGYVGHYNIMLFTIICFFVLYSFHVRKFIKIKHTNACVILIIYRYDQPNLLINLIAISYIALFDSKSKINVCVC